MKATLPFVATLLVLTATIRAEDPQPPNFIVIFTDDQGYADLGCYGSGQIETPHIDRLAAEGLRFTSFYAAPFCGPSRAALMTGSYPPRLSLAFNHGPAARTGLHPDEVTIAEVLRDRGYATMHIGKWHLGDHRRFLPTRNGFDQYFGLPYSNDMWPFHPRMPKTDDEHPRLTAARKRAEMTGYAGQGSYYAQGRGFPQPLPLMRGERVLETNPDQRKLTTEYTREALKFLSDNKDRPFFLYLAHAMPHVPLFVSEKFSGKSKRGLYGDVIQEIDWSVGQIVSRLEELKIDRRTLVVFTSDNGPWLQYGIDGGSAGPLRAGKGTLYEGGVRVPGIFWGRGHIPGGRETGEIACTMDLLPTFAKLAGAELPSDRVIDGRDIGPLLAGKAGAPSPHDAFYYFGGSRRGQPNLRAVRQGRWKLHLRRAKDGALQARELYDLEADVGETLDRSADEMQVVAELEKKAQEFLAELIENTRPLGRLDELSTPFAVGDWVEHGYSAEDREALRRVYRDAIDEKVIPGGSLLLLHKGAVIFREAFGVADLESKRPFTTENPCFIASVTKPHTATALAILADRGTLSLDDRVDKYLPEFRDVQIIGKGPATRAPTIAECLSHTAGFVGNAAIKRGRFPVPQEGTLAERVADAARRGLVTQPGRRYAYSRLGYMTAARAAEVATGRPFPEILSELLLDPIGATEATFFPSPEFRKQVPVAYSRDDGAFRRLWKNDVARRPLNPGGSLVSTLDGVGRLLLLHRNRGVVDGKRLVSAKALEAMYVRQPATRGTGYGLGLGILETRANGTARRLQHGGASGTLAWIDFDADLIVVSLTQVPSAEIRPFRQRLMAEIRRIFVE